MNEVIIVTEDGRRVARKFRNEDLGQSFYKLVLDRHPQDNIYLVNLTKTTPIPEDLNHVPGMMYCPYCGTERFFVEVEDVRGCSVCHITTRNFYVKTYNGLWEHISKAKGGKKK